MDVSDPAAAPLHTRTCDCPSHGVFASRAIELPALGRKPGKLIWSRCPVCGREAAAREAAAQRAEQEQARQQRMEDRLNRAGIPKRFRARSFENYMADSDAKRHALATARGFAEDFSAHARRGTTLVLAGNVGTGKGHLALSVAQHVMSLGHSVFFATAREVVLMLRGRWDDRSAPGEMEVLRMLTAVSLLVIDEVGVQFHTDAERDQLFGVLDGRYRDLMPTLLTTNLSRRLLQQAIGERSYSRLREQGIWVPFDWEDFRARKAGAGAAAAVSASAGSAA